MMKSFCIAICSFFCVMSSLTAQSEIPSILLKDLDEKEVDLQTYATDGKITLLVFWTTWAGPSKRELDAIATVYADWQAAYGVELVAVSIDYEKHLSKVQPLVESKGWTYKVLTDTSGACMRNLQFNSIPITLLLDSEGKIVFNHKGYDAGDELKIEEQIKLLLEK